MTGHDHTALTDAIKARAREVITSRPDSARQFAQAGQHQDLILTKLAETLMSGLEPAIAAAVEDAVTPLRQRAEQAEAALDKIATYVQPDDGPGWCDPYGKLEAIGNIIESTGRTVNWDGPDYDDDEEAAA